MRQKLQKTCQLGAEGEIATYRSLSLVSSLISFYGYGGNVFLICPPMSRQEVVGGRYTLRTTMLQARSGEK